MNAKIAPGQHTVQTMNGMPGVYVESIKFGEVEIYGRSFEIWNGLLPIRIRYRSGAPVVRGTAGTEAGATVAIVNANENIDSGGVSTATTGSGGRFEFGNLRPGDYFVVALDRNHAAIATPAFRRSILSRREKIHLEKKGDVSLNLKITSSPE